MSPPRLHSTAAKTRPPPSAAAVRYVRGVGAARAALLEHMGIHTVEDLLLTLPRRYQDRRRMVKIRDLEGGAQATVAGTIQVCGLVRPRFGRTFFEAIVGDTTGLLKCRWYNATYLRDQFKVGTRLLLFGKVTRYRGSWIMQHPEYEILDRENDDPSALNVGRIVPVYPLTEQLGQRAMRRIMWNAVETYSGDFHEMLPEATRRRHGLPDIVTAIRQVHFPPDMHAAEAARYRLVFEEFLCIQLVLAARKVQSERFLKGIRHAAAGKLRRRLIDSLHFRLTSAQERVIREINCDMSAPHPMHRLLQGDVGSGKTLVAACAILDAVECGSQAAVMSPTEILAAQHARTLAHYLAPMGIKTTLLTGRLPGPERRRRLEDISANRTAVVIGTHALIQEDVRFHRLGLVVIDEQHRFGVAQRARLYEKGSCPDILVMTATPIPRTLAMTVYGDLDISILDEMPPGRRPVVTRLIPHEKLPQAYDFIRREVVGGRQAFIVCPRVEESPLSDLRSVKELATTLSMGPLKGLRLDILHGRMSPEEKDAVMERFRAAEIDVLITTTVVEVGIDIPNASTMLVENAERFGLAQLHQLRGRIGRGPHRSFCILQSRPEMEEAWRRLEVLQKTSDGFRIAEEDLRLRGMGDLLGQEQTGLPALRVGNLLEDQEILRAARQEAFTILEADPHLQNPEYGGLKERARRLYVNRGRYAKVG